MAIWFVARNKETGEWSGGPSPVDFEYAPRKVYAVLADGQQEALDAVKNCGPELEVLSPLELGLLTALAKNPGWTTVRASLCAHALRLRTKGLVELSDAGQFRLATAAIATSPPPAASAPDSAAASTSLSVIDILARASAGAATASTGTVADQNACRFPVTVAPQTRAFLDSQAFAHNQSLAGLCGLILDEVARETLRRASSF
ncbi:hypothetical protein LJR118_006760 [Acidovorax sp. LjRoot118]|uniref:hypothetical protein n=1 Tax=Acidovorax sp. LjRoot118 TaxID=3342256 RepID=UPI003ED00463